MDEDFKLLSKSVYEFVDKIKSGVVKGHTRFECKYCYNSGFRNVEDPKKGPYCGVVRCNKCKYWAIRSGKNF